MPARDVTRWWDHMTHVVNVAMGLKEPAMRYVLDGDPRHRRQLDADLANLDEWHGQVHGFFSGDEWLAGTDARRGTELCAVVEAMFSFEVLLRVWGGVDYGDRLENLAYNLLPAALDARMTAHQYHQQANQVLATVANRDWTQAGDDCTIFGLEPNFGCCTANYHQGWPKFVASLWMATVDGPGLAAVAHGPSRVDADIAGTRVRIDAETGYPFEEQIRYRVDPESPVDFTLAMRIPGWCGEPELSVNGAPEPVVVGGDAEPGYARIERTWSAGDIVKLTLPMAVQMQERPSGGVGVSLGPLRLVASPGEIWTRLASRLEHGSCRAARDHRGQAVTEPEVYGPLVPYGSTRLRIAEFPNAEPSRLGQIALDHAPE